MAKLVIAKTHGNYYRVYKDTKKEGIPFSPFEFTNKAAARKWIKNNKTYKGYFYTPNKKKKK